MSRVGPNFRVGRVTPIQQFFFWPKFQLPFGHLISKCKGPPFFVCNSNLGEGIL